MCYDITADHVTYTLEEKPNFLTYSIGQNFLYSFLHLSLKTSGQVQERVLEITPYTFAGNMKFLRKGAGF